MTQQNDNAIKRGKERAVWLRCACPAVLVAMTGGLCTVAAEDLTLVRDGQPAAVIVLTPDSASRETGMVNRQAADELVRHIRMMSGAELGVLVTLTNGGFQPIGIAQAKAVDIKRETVKDIGGLIPIRLGAAADPALDEWLAAATNAPDAFVLAVDASGVQIRGRLPVGVQHGVLALLGQLGVRWHDPLVQGLVVPARKTVALPHQRLAATPPPEQALMAPVTPRGTIYTVRMKHELVARILQSPYASPTLSGDAGGVIGWSDGWPVRIAGGVAEGEGDEGHEMVLGTRKIEVPAFPPQPIYGCRITDRTVTEGKTVVVLTDGNHSEFTGSWSFHGFVEFLLGDEPQAAELRRLADFHIYPLVNPDGRLMLRRTDNPALSAAGWANHLATWVAPGCFASGDTLTSAIRFDTGGRAGYLIDFHSNGTCIYTPPGLVESALVKAMTARVPSMLPGGYQSHSTVEWAMGADGLGVPFAFQPEHNPWLSLDECREIGRAYALALHDALTGQVTGVASNAVGGITRPPPAGKGATALLQAVLKGDLAAAEKALQAGDGVNAANHIGIAPLHAAAQLQDPVLVRLLLERGADARQANRRGWTPLHYAARYGRAETAALLLGKGAAVGARMADGDTPLHLAAAYDRGDVVEILLAAGADPAARGQWNRTPLDWAERLGYAKVAARLREGSR